MCVGKHIWCKKVLKFRTLPQDHHKTVQRGPMHSQNYNSKQRLEDSFQLALSVDLRFIMSTETSESSIIKYDGSIKQDSPDPASEIDRANELASITEIQSYLQKYSTTSSVFAEQSISNPDYQRTLYWYVSYVIFLNLKYTNYILFCFILLVFLVFYKLSFLMISKMPKEVLKRILNC